MIPRKGAHVARLSIKDIMDVLEVRASLDGLATALAAERITDEELRELKYVLNQFESYVEKDNLQNIVKKDVEFHDIIYHASKNDKLIQIVNNLREQVYRFRVIYLKDFSSTKEVIKEHIEIFDALIEKDSNAAGEAAKSHIKNQEMMILKRLENNNSN